MVTLQTADNALKTFYLDAISREIDGKASAFLSQIEKTSMNVVGKSVTKVIKTGVHGGIGAGSETGDLPTGDGGDVIAFHAPLKNLYGTIEISDKAIRASASDEGAFVNLLNEEMQGLVKSAKYNFGRMLFGEGNGKLAQVSTGYGSDTLYVDTVNAIEEGMYVDVYDGGQKIATKAKVVSVNKMEKRISLGGVNWGSKLPGETASVYIHGAENGYELTGLGALFSNEDIYDTDRSKEYMNPYIYSCPDAFSLEVLDESIDRVEERSGSRVNFMLCSWAVKRIILKCARENNVQIGTTTIGDNMHVPTYNGIPIVVDRFCPENTLYLLNTNDFKICQLCDWQWMEGEDGKILKQVPGKPVYTATLVKYAELICEKPFGQAAITDIYEEE